MKKKNLLHNIKLVSFILSIIIIIFDIIILVNDYLEEKNAITTKARISSLEYQNNKLSAKISYEVEKEIYEIPYEIDNDDYAIGDNITIKYNKNNPSKLINNNHLLIIVISIPIIIILLKISMQYLIKYFKINKKIKYLKNHGILINAPILEVYNNKRKNKFYYIVRLKYINPQDDTSYIFESEESVVNLNNNITKKGITSLPVYIDPQNTTSYYVDMSSILF